jgi:hypothetical protein
MPGAGLLSHIALGLLGFSSMGWKRANGGPFWRYLSNFSRFPMSVNPGSSVTWHFAAKAKPFFSNAFPATRRAD